MPLEVLIHAANCPTKRRPCGCNPKAFDATDYQAVREAHRGDCSRMEIGTYKPPARSDTYTPAGTQAKRHLRDISN